MAELLGTARLVTLTGMAGVGKTRLALAVATAVAEGHGAGARLVELATTTDPALVPATVAAVLGVREQPGRRLVETLIGQLRYRLLLVMDNCEHLIDAAAGLVEALLRACPDLRVLATSREPLGIGGEIAWLVPPLPVPPARASADDVGVYEAVRLFTERAGAVEPGFALTAAMAPAVGEICRRLDGLPLAIELAAARIRVLSPPEIAARLDDRFALLTAGSRTGPSRQQSLQAALEWSYELLGNPERVLLRRLSVFAAGCTLDAAEQVCAGEDLPSGQFFDLLAGLVAKSLVVANISETQARYRLLETIHHFAANRLAECGETDMLRDRHAAYYTGLAEQAEPELIGTGQIVWLERWEVEHDNLSAALQWSLTRGKPEQGLRLAVAVSKFWSIPEHIAEGRDWLERALSASPDASPVLRAKALCSSGVLAGLAGDNMAAVAAAEQSLTLAHESADTQASARALNLLGTCAQLYDPELARSQLEESIRLARHARDYWCLSASFAMLGWSYLHQGEYLTAGCLLRKCLAVGWGMHDTKSTALAGLGYVALHQGDYGQAETLGKEAMAVAQQLGDRLWTACALGCLGGLAGVQGDYAQARSRLDESLALAREGGYRHVVALALGFLGKVALAEGNPAAARLLFQEGLAVVQVPGHQIIAAGLLVRVAEASYALDDVGTARALFEQALAEARRSGVRPVMAQALSGLGKLARADGDCGQAAAWHQQALRLEQQMGRTPGVIESLEMLAGLAAHQGRSRFAVRLFSAAQTQREAIGYVRPVTEQHDYDSDLAAARQGLSSEQFTTAWEQGTKVSLHEAMTFVIQSCDHRRKAATGWDSLTTAEHEVARLAAEGLTNPEIGERLFISRRTVQTHLTHIYAKLGIASRKQLGSRTRVNKMTS